MPGVGGGSGGGSSGDAWMLVLKSPSRSLASRTGEDSEPLWDPGDELNEMDDVFDVADSSALR